MANPSCVCHAYAPSGRKERRKLFWISRYQHYISRAELPIRPATARVAPTPPHPPWAISIHKLPNWPISRKLISVQFTFCLATPRATFRFSADAAAERAADADFTPLAPAPRAATPARRHRRPPHTARTAEDETTTPSCRRPPSGALASSDGQWPTAGRPARCRSQPARPPPASAKVHQRQGLL